MALHLDVRGESSGHDPAPGPFTPATFTDAELAELSASFESAPAEEIVDWAGSTNVIPGGSGQFVIQSGPVYGLTGRVNF